jgi:putative flippase GtrA
VARVTGHSATRFLLVGALSVGIDAGMLYVLHGLAGIWLPVATAMSYLISLAFNFAVNRAWTFEATGAAGRHLIRYLTLVAVNLGLTVLLVQLLTVMGLPYLASKLCTAAVLAVANYFVSRAWVYD